MNSNKTELSSSTSKITIMTSDSVVTAVDHHLPPNPMRLRDALDLYLEKISVTKRGHQHEIYRARTICMTSIADKLVHELTPVDIANFRDERLAMISKHTRRPVAPATVLLELSMLSDMIRIGSIEWGIADPAATNPVLQIRKPRVPPGRTRRLTAHEERAIILHCRAQGARQMLAMFQLAIETAMRQGELLGLEWERINLKTRIIHLAHTKNGHSRDVPLSPRAVELLRELDPRVSGKAFTYTAQGFKSSWRVMMKRLGIKNLRFHDLRHEAVSRLFELGTLDIMEVASISGHRTLSCLKRYTHLKARNLVKKLEQGHRKRKKAIGLLDQIVGYPAKLLVEGKKRVTICLPDFPNLVITAKRVKDALHRAKDALLRELFVRIKANESPPPSNFLDQVDGRRVILLDPI